VNPHRRVRKSFVLPILDISLLGSRFYEDFLANSMIPLPAMGWGSIVVMPAAHAHSRTSASRAPELFSVRYSQRNWACGSRRWRRFRVHSKLGKGTQIALTMANTRKPTFDALLDAARTTVAAVVSLLLARLLKLPESYWAPISAIVIIQSTINPRTVAWQRFAGTALGAALGALVATFFPSNVLVYAVAIFLCGALCALLRLRSAYRFAAITLSIILLIAHQSPAWIVASHRFVEVSVGIAVALALTQLWPSRT